MSDDMRKALEAASDMADFMVFGKELSLRESYLIQKLAQLILIDVVKMGAKKGDPEDDFKKAVLCVTHDLFEFDKLDPHTPINAFGRTIDTMAKLGALLDSTNGGEA